MASFRKFLQPSDPAFSSHRSVLNLCTGQARRTRGWPPTEAACNQSWMSISARCFSFASIRHEVHLHALAEVPMGGSTSALWHSLLWAHLNWLSSLSCPFSLPRPLLVLPRSPSKMNPLHLNPYLLMGGTNLRHQALKSFLLFAFHPFANLYRSEKQVFIQGSLWFSEVFRNDKKWIKINRSKFYFFKKHLMINMIHLILGDKLITKLFFIIKWWGLQRTHYQEAQDVLLEASSCSPNSSWLCKNAEQREKWKLWAVS